MRKFTHARREIFEYFEGWYKSLPRHSALGYLSPVKDEKRQQLAA